MLTIFPLLAVTCRDFRPQARICVRMRGQNLRSTVRKPL